MDHSGERTRLSIGAVADATGIPAATLRTWERRYGFPAPERNRAGHRRYRPDVIDRLKLLARARLAGHRISNIIGLSTERLTALLAESLDERSADYPPRRAPPADPHPELWLVDAFVAAAAYNVDALDQLLSSAWNRTTALSFLTDYAELFLERLGAAWAAGFLSIGQEHLASHKFRQFLNTRWEMLSHGRTGPTVLLTTPEGELHELGLHMAAVVFSLTNWSIVFLGANTPTETIIETARTSLPTTVGISIAESYDRARAHSVLRTVRRELPPNIELVAGGHGTPADVEGVRRIIELPALHEWAAGHQ